MEFFCSSPPLSDNKHLNTKNAFLRSCCSNGAPSTDSGSLLLRSRTEEQACLHYAVVQCLSDHVDAYVENISGSFFFDLNWAAMQFR
mmetsp:Transcript_20687/g.35542  ORF Transcript_20687/g.35542 Transcript_20687/m.35542 type:complete len:87 (+) Transcript_20687:699-959(+)